MVVSKFFNILYVLLIIIAVNYDGKDIIHICDKFINYEMKTA